MLTLQAGSREPEGMKAQLCGFLPFLALVFSSQATISARPVGIDPALDCEIKQFALSYAQGLLPALYPLGSVFDALQLSPEWGLPPPIRKQSGSNPWNSFVASTPWTHTRVGRNVSNTFFVDPVNGNDGNSGTIGSPLQTIQAALERCRSSSQVRNHDANVALVELFDNTEARYILFEYDN